MSDQIKPGDLVMVVKTMPCCGYDGGLGTVFRASEITQEYVKCSGCEAVRFNENELVGIDEESCVETYRLKKLNPPAEEESRETTKELEVV